MDNTDQITPYPSTERGAGGKLRKPPPRKPPASPYARPSSSSTTTNRRWISKLVDPAYRIIAGGATRFLPSFFSTSDSASTPVNPSSSNEEVQEAGKWRTGEQHNEDNLLKSNLHILPSELSKMANTGDGGSSKLNNSFDFDMPSHVQKEEQHENNKFSDIEQLLKGKKFTRDEFDHIVGLLNSRAIDVSNGEQRKENTNLTSRQDDGGLVVADKLPKVFNERRHEESNGVIRESSTPCVSKGRDEFGASPVEIARAYMDSRASEAGPSSKNMIQTVESTMLCNGEAAMKLCDPSPSKKSPTCWPGAVVHDAYTTPQTQGSKYGLLNHARTPYSRTLLMKSKSKLIHPPQGNYSHISSTPLRQSQTSLYLKDKSEVGASESGYGSVGPIRRTRHKVALRSTPQRPAYSSTPQRPAYSSMNSSQRQNSSFIEYSNSTVATSTGPGRMSSTRKPLGFEHSVPTVHMHTSLMAKKILEHIDRSVPTPKEKSAELKLATKWKNPESSVNTSTIFSNEYNGLVKLKDVSPCKYDELGGMNSTLRNENEGSRNVDIQPRESADKSIDITKEGTLASDLNVHNSIPRLTIDGTTQNFGSSQMFPMKSTYEDGLMALSSGGRYPSLVNQEKKTAANNAASKPVLAPISVKKPESNWTLASDNTSGFTFPVTAPSSVFSEPPTPSIMPLLVSTGNKHQPQEIPTQLSYSFGIKKSNPAVVFSFPSTSNIVHNDDGVIKYNFGSTDKARLSFSFGNTAVNC
ncbi:nuclear pore complex protein NUP1 [Trifolium pratense]|uniref:nuclear pore complex protein NUP1 n=1 Tax=Trifolium pratense TaxID=57577 RepID=UPI001E690236|nr:nuclear pore complex protein NUP1 [Trifolium pratense]